MTEGNANGINKKNLVADFEVLNFETGREGDKNSFEVE
jgi:hypothetical protein